MFVAHFDIDAFYASVAIRDDPALRGLPVAVAGSSRRAVVLTASYEARPFGVRSAVPLYRAKQACPQLIVVPPDMPKYKEISRQVFAIFERRGQAVEGLSMDEAFVEVGDATFEQARAFAQKIRDDVLAETQLTVSAGVATGKMVAKIASDLCKPDGLLAIAPGDEAAFLAPLPVGRLWGIGPKTQARVNALGIRTIGDVAALTLADAHALFGSWGPDVRELALGIDRRRVESERETKSISTEETFEYDVTDDDKLRTVLREQAAELAEKLAREDLSAHSIGIKIRRRDFSTISRQTHLNEPTREAGRIYAASSECLRRAALEGQPVRLLGTRAAMFVAGDNPQVSLFAGAEF